MTDEEDNTRHHNVITANAPVATLAPPQTKTSTGSKLLPSIFAGRRPSLTPSVSSDREDMATSGQTTPRPGDATGDKKRPKFKRSASKQSSYTMGTQKDVLGIVMIEIQQAEDLPKIPNSKLSSISLLT